ncbi:MAG: antitoxin VapB family protein [Thermoplasmata archaeon]
MPSHNIAVQRAVYDALKKERRPGESFTRLLDRLLHERGTLADLSGAWGPRATGADRGALAGLRSGGRS